MRLKDRFYPIIPKSVEKFLFQTGAIKSKCKIDAKRGGSSFYSKLVRLKAPAVIAVRKFVISFLFQTGAIKRSDGTLRRSAIQVMFLFQTGAIKSENGEQSTKPNNTFLFQTGAIKSIRGVFQENDLNQVSIPNWCD